MNKVLVIGANGFLGSNLSKKLASEGIEVTALVARGLDYSFIEGKNHIQCIEFELDTLADLDNHPALQGIDTIFHMAWAGVSTTFKNEAETQARNILYGLSVLEFAQRHGINRVIVPGSASEFACGNGVINGKNESAPSDLYSASKVATRFLCQTYAKQNGIDFIWTAITSIYGPGRNDNNLITYAIKTLLNGEKPSFTGLEQQWDYLYIDDLIDALIAIGQKGEGGKIYPIGSGEHRQMNEYVRIIRNAINPSLPLGIGDLPYKNKTIDNQILDISSLQEDTGFQPKYSFEEGIQKTIDYFRLQIVSE